MVTVGRVTQGNRWYYESQVAQGREDYYYEGGEAPGRWVGAWASELGLEGTASFEQAQRMLDGCDPVTGTSLYMPDPKGGRPRTVQAYDLTFSAPKSVSILWACVRDQKTHLTIQKAHDWAVDEAIEAVEREALYAGQKEKRSQVNRSLGIAYRHRFSREADPQLHSHVLLANMAESPDGQVRSLDGKEIFYYAKVARRHYHAALREKLSAQLGVNWTAVNGQGTAEIEGVGERVRDEFSRRSRRIYERAAELAQAGQPVNLTIAKHDTRPRKPDSLDFEAEHEGFRARAQEHGLDEQAIQALLAQDEGDYQRLMAADLEAFEQTLLGRDGLTRHKNTFTTQDAFCALMDAAPLGMAERADDELHGFLTRGEVVPLADGTYTTQALLDREGEILDGVKRRRESDTAVLDQELVEHVLARHDYLTRSQREAIRAVTGSGHGIENIEALAGTGKTTVLGVLAEAYREAGFDVQGTTPSARAARELEGVGVEARTHHSLEGALRRGYGFSAERPTVLLADEQSMTGTWLWSEIVSAAEAHGAKVVQTGDSGQLPSVEAGGSFAAISQRFGAQQLTEVVRQRDQAERRALRALHEGRPEPFIAYHQRKGTVRTHRNEDEATLAALSSWWRAQERAPLADVLLISFSRRVRAQLNEQAREILEREGRLSGDVLVTSDGTQIQCGERVIARENDYGIGIENGTRGTVEAVDLENHSLRLHTDDGRDIAVPSDYLDRGSIEYAYAITGHQSQGATAEYAIPVGAPSEFTREWAYTAASRAREQTELHLFDDSLSRTPEIEPPHAPEGHDLLDEIRRNLARPRAEQLAVRRGVGSPHASRSAYEEQANRGPKGGSQTSIAGTHDREQRKELSRLRDEQKRLREIVATYPDKSARALSGYEADIQSYESSAETEARRRERLEQDLDKLGPIKRRGSKGDELRSDIEAAAQREASFREKAESAHDRAETIRQGPFSPERWERDNPGVRRQLQSVEHRLDRQIDQIAERSVESPPAYVRRVLGERPEPGSGREHYDRSSQEIERYRLKNEVPQSERSALGRAPSDPSTYSDWLGAANRVLDTRETLGLDRGDQPFSERMSCAEGLVPEQSLEHFRSRGLSRGFER